MRSVDNLKITKAKESPIEFGIRCKGCRTFNVLTGKGPFLCRRCDRPLPVEAEPVEQAGQPVLHFKYVPTGK